MAELGNISVLLVCYGFVTFLEALPCLYMLDRLMVLGCCLMKVYILRDVGALK